MHPSKRGNKDLGEILTDYIFHPPEMALEAAPQAAKDRWPTIAPRNERDWGEIGGDLAPTLVMSPGGSPRDGRPDLPRNTNDTNSQGIPPGFGPNTPQWSYDPKHQSACEAGRQKGTLIKPRTRKGINWTAGGERILQHARAREATSSQLLQMEDVRTTSKPLKHTPTPTTTYLNGLTPTRPVPLRREPTYNRHYYLVIPHTHQYPTETNLPQTERTSQT
ncbi:hypothetical protein HNY73_015718 [Argiope bruennichi]|uniref:Uncharacterized protein n=1 Tax=Argiope bruennichi TaxID=94029 RepID=A0A8T0EGQ1_ARGBR|nr:hypothetical protein HNY73_015718 [Argiope bruennichi]